MENLKDSEAMGVGFDNIEDIERLEMPQDVEAKE